MIRRVFELPCLDNRKSFYGKAIVLEDENGEKFLQSYDTTVCKVDANGKVTKLWDGYSATTQRHINSFLSFFGIRDYQGKANWSKLPTEKSSRVYTNMEAWNDYQNILKKRRANVVHG